VDEAAEWGEELTFLDRAAVREEVHSPLWQAGLFRPPEQGRDALLDPAKLVRGLRRVAAERGVAIHEGSAVSRSSGGPAASSSEPPRGRASARTTSSSPHRRTRAGCGA
jgi:glycine/D-amino acid oxidase-like deaminating enzyme